MIKKLYAILGMLAVAYNCYAQIPTAKRWDKRWGGTDYDWFRSIKQTSDDGYILLGYSFSGISGDKTQPNWGSTDYWIVKTDSLGNKLWDKRFGGTDDEKAYVIEQIPDAGYILGGASASDISGDKTQSCRGLFDYWIVKIDSAGTKLWDKRYGGGHDDDCLSVQLTLDSGYILGGYCSFSLGQGDITEPLRGGTDYWMVKTYPLGNKIWDKRFGGSGDDYGGYTQQTVDGGYLVAGTSRSGISGDKTQANWSVDTADYWIVKTDSMGNKLWDKRYGGTGDESLVSFLQTPDGGYILSGGSNSGISGDKTEVNWDSTLNTYDYWVVKIDALGNKLWDKRYGGTSSDLGGYISHTLDGGYLITGMSDSNISGDKTENNLGDRQTWIVKIDSVGNKLWDKTLFLNSGSHYDYLPKGLQTNDSCYVFAIGTYADTGGYKTQPNWDTTFTMTTDYWMIKFCDTIITTAVPDLQSSTFKFQLSPNPATTTIQLTINTKHNAPVDCEIMNVMGEVVYKFQIPNTNFQTSNSKLQTNLDVSFLAKGIYLVRMGDGKSFENRKLVVE